jgi:GAF domain-containing protein
VRRPFCYSGTVERLRDFRCSQCNRELALRSAVGRYQGACPDCDHPYHVVVYAGPGRLRAIPLPPVATNGLLGELADWLGILGARKGNVQLLDPRARSLTIRAHVGFGPAFLKRFRTVSAGGDSVCGEALEQECTIVARDVFRNDRFPSLREIFRGEGLVGVFSTPIVDDGGAVLGMVSAHFPSSHEPSPKDRTLAERRARRFATFLREPW